MKRAEMEQELAEVKKWSASYSSDGNRSADAAVSRLLKWFDEVQRELGYVGALRARLDGLVVEKVGVEVELREALVELDILRSRSGSDVVGSGVGVVG